MGLMSLFVLSALTQLVCVAFGVFAGALMMRAWERRH